MLFRTDLLYFLRATTLLFLSPVLSLWRKKYQHIPTVTPDFIPEMEPQPLEGYSDKQFYLRGETISFYLHSVYDLNTLTIYRLSNPYTYIPVFEVNFSKTIQKQVKPVPVTGLNWNKTVTFNIPPDFEPGYYRACLTTSDIEIQSDITFIIGTPPTNKIVILAPVTTWLAYNPYGGQSLYKNATNGASVYQVSTRRPNTALQYEALKNIHDVNIEANIYNWFNKEFKADIFPDYYLEKEPEVFKKYAVVVLAYHAEYFSANMYKSLRHLIYNQNKSLIALGGNQVYWQVKWNQAFTQLECRKDATTFTNTRQPGGMWRQTSEPEDKLLGVRYTEAGMGTYAPYQVVKPGHWLFKNTVVQKGDLFGQLGINQIPICGDETDKRTFISKGNTTVLAKGLNKYAQADFDIYKQNEPEWNGAGGGELVLNEVTDTQGILATGSIQSGAGLGSDAIFSTIIRNFVNKYLV